MTGTRSPTPALRADNDAAVSRAELWRWVAGVVLVTVSVLVVVLLAGGGAPQAVPAGLPDSGPVTGWGLPAVRLLTDLAGLATVGLLLAAGLLLSSPEMTLAAAPARAATLAGRVAAVWLLAVVAEVVLTVSDIFGISPAQATEATVLRSFLGQTSQGRALLVQIALLIVVAGLARAAASPRGAVLALVVALVAMTPPALTGHSAASGSHELAVASRQRRRPAGRCGAVAVLGVRRAGAREGHRSVRARRVRLVAPTENRGRGGGRWRLSDASVRVGRRRRAGSDGGHGRAGSRPVSHSHP